MTKSKNKVTHHMAIRIKSEDGKTISEHRRVIKSRNSVLFAKIGKGISTKTVNRLNEQINLGVKTYLVLAVNEGRNKPYGFYLCDLCRVHESLNDECRALVPDYLIGNAESIENWLEISSIKRISQKEAPRLYVLSSNKELSGALNGTASIFNIGIKGLETIKTTSDPASKKNLEDESLEDYYDDYQDDSEYLSNLFD